MTLTGLGKVLITAPSVSHSYDTVRLDAVCLELTAERPELAAAIAKCRKTSQRAGSLRIEQERK